MTRVGRHLLRRIARFNTNGECFLCQHYLAEGQANRLPKHIERDHAPEDFGLSPTGERTAREVDA